VPVPVAALQALALRGTFERAARTLAAAGIPVMPLKGILLAYWVYPDPADRLGVDVDLLVPPARWEEAVERLKADGFRARERPWNLQKELILSAPPLGIELDLHQALFSAGRFRLPPADVFGRGRADRSLYGIPVVLPDPLDVVAHLVGHAASDHRMASLRRLAADLERLAAAFRLAPGDAARRLEEAGMARAARLILGLIGEASPFGAGTRLRLSPDAVSDAIADASAVLMRRFPTRSLLSILAGHLSNTSLPQAALSAAFSLTLRLRGALRRPS
jgi:hypothetical protein